MLATLVVYSLLDAVCNMIHGRHVQVHKIAPVAIEEAHMALDELLQGTIKALRQRINKLAAPEDARGTEGSRII